MSGVTRRTLVRLEGQDAEGAVRAAQEMADGVGGFVVGTDLLVERGPILVATLCAVERPVLVDIGILDSAPVVARVVGGLGKLGARWVSVSGLSGHRAIESAVAEAAGFPGTAVVVSASLPGWAGREDMSAAGISDSPGRQVSRMTRLAERAGAGGIIFPARELGVAVQVSARARGGSRVGNSGGFTRMAEATGRLSSTEDTTHEQIDAHLEGGADWVIVSQGVSLRGPERA